jgi:hypothetical protein
MERVSRRVRQIVIEANLKHLIRGIADLEMEAGGILLVRIAAARANRGLDIKITPRHDATRISAASVPAGLNDSKELVKRFP